MQGRVLVTAIALGGAVTARWGGGPSGTETLSVKGSSQGGGFHEPAGMAVQINTGPITASPSIFTVFSPATPSPEGEWRGNLSVVPHGTGLRMTYPTVLSGGYSPVRFGVSIPSAGTGWYYLRMKIRLSPNWTMSGNNTMKFCEPLTQQHGSGQGPNENHVIGANDFLSTSAHSFFYVALQGPNGHFQNLREKPANNPASDLAGGAWHLVEVLFTPESAPGAGDGTYAGWVDGVQVANWTSVLWLAPGNAVGWPHLMFDPTYGGGRNSPAQKMYWDMDELYVSTR